MGQIFAGRKFREFREFFENSRKLILANFFALSNSRKLILAKRFSTDKFAKVMTELVEKRWKIHVFLKIIPREISSTSEFAKISPREIFLVTEFAKINPREIKFL